MENQIISQVPSFIITGCHSNTNTHTLQLYRARSGFIDPTKYDLQSANIPASESDLTGKKFGRWTVIGNTPTLHGNERKWLCRCVCGTERAVLERSLRYGSSLSCGCLRTERTRQTNSPDLTGQQFGELTVVRRIQKESKSRGAFWLCKCACGADYEVLGTLLVTGKRTHCPGKNHKRNYVYSDITGKKFGRLTVLYPGSQRDRKGSIVWHCRCDCGNEVDISYDRLVYTSQKSCGCQKKEHNQKLNTYLTHVADTSIEMLKSKKTPVNNTTGFKGVYFIRGKYVAKIVFQKKTYYLGSYDNVEDAFEARKKAEEELFDRVIEYYAQWKSKADADPAWAKENPVQIQVSQDHNKNLRVSFLPSLTEHM